MNFADFFAGLHGSMEHRLPPPPTEDEVAELYGALGLNPGASANEIRKAYLKLARTKHPDRGGDPTEFHAIQEAFDILGNDDKRAVFMRCGHKGLEAGLSAEDVDPEARRRREQKPPDLRLGMRCRLEDLLKPVAKEVEVPRVVAEGGAQRRETVTVNLNIPASAPNGFPLRLMEQGHVVDGVRGDVLVVLRVNDHPVYNRQGPDLVMEKRLSLRQALSGVVLELPLLEGGTIAVAVPPGRALGDPLVIRGHGLPLNRTGVGARGAIIVQVSITMPSRVPGVKLSQKLADLAWEELAPLTRSRRAGGRAARRGGDDEEEDDEEEGGMLEEPLQRFAPDSLGALREQVDAAHSARATGAFAPPGAPEALVSVEYETLNRDEMRSRHQDWARNCGAERLEEEQGGAGGPMGGMGGQVVQCGHQ